MSKNSIKSIAIVGGGTAGWMTAAALSRFLKTSEISITLIESELIGTVGVGEATIPHIRYFNEMLGISETDFMRNTNATYKLGIEFSNWGDCGEAYLHPFGTYGRDHAGVSFHHFWLKSKMAGNPASISDYSIGVQAAYAEKFSYPSRDSSSFASKFGYAFHIDASMYAAYLRKYSESNGVARMEGTISHASIHPETGFITHVSLESGRTLEADLFIDCSGFRALLLGQAMKVEYEDWSQWLQCDRAVAIPSEKLTAPVPYSKAIAQDYGWRWRIPLQNRTGNGYVYCSKYISDDNAAQVLVSQLDGKPLANPNFLRFTPGRRKKSWVKNCVGIGLAGGFLEPLESTSIYLIQLGIMKLLDFFPDNHFSQALADEFNRSIQMEYERIRDFLILHYAVTRRKDTMFWRHCGSMSLPESLRYKMALFKKTGQVEFYKKGLFLEPSWVAVYLGQGIIPECYHPVCDNFGYQLDLDDIRQKINAIVESMPPHTSSIKNHCDNESEIIWPPANMSLYGVFS